MSAVLASNALFYHLVDRNKDKLPYRIKHRMQATVNGSVVTFECDHNCVQQHVICKNRKWSLAPQHFDLRVHVVTNIIVKFGAENMRRVFKGIPAMTSAHCMEVSTDRAAHLQRVFAQLKNLRHLRVNFSPEVTRLDLTFLSENFALGVRRLELYFEGGVDEFPHHEFFRFLFDFSLLPVGSKAKKVFVKFGGNKSAFPTSFVSDILEKLNKLEGKLTVELPLHEPDVVASTFIASDNVKCKKNDHTFAAQRSSVAIFMFDRYATITNEMQTANTYFSLVK